MMIINVRAVLRNSLSIVLLMVASGQPVSAEWLIGYDGSRLETRGPWKVQDSRIVLTLPDGKLVSIAVDDIDLERSLAESAPTLERPVEYQPPRRHPSVVWTNRNLPASESERNLGEPSTPGSFELSQKRLRVEFWVALDDGRGQGIAIQGTLRNSSATILRITEAWAEIVDPVAGTLNQPIVVRDPLLAPGEATSFRARFVGLGKKYADPEFTVLVEPHHSSISEVD